MTLLTEEQLKACEAAAPFMVSEYRKLLLTKLDAELLDAIQSLREDLIKTTSDYDGACNQNNLLKLLVKSLTYTLLSGIHSHDAMTELKQRAKDLGCYP